MRPGYLLPLAAAASAAALPGDASKEQATAVAAWSSVPVRDEALPSIDEVVESVGGALVRGAGVTAKRTAPSLASSAENIDDFRTAAPRNTHMIRSLTSGRDVTETVDQIIRESEQGRRFAELLERHGKLLDRLADADEEHTVFVPTNDAIRRLENLGRSDEVLMEVLEYHVILGKYSTGTLGDTRTVPTTLREGETGRQQRLRVGSDSSGPNLNFYARVSPADSVGRLSLSPHPLFSLSDGSYLRLW